MFTISSPGEFLYIVWNRDGQLSKKPEHQN